MLGSIGFKSPDLVEELQQALPNLRVCLLRFVEQDHAAVPFIAQSVRQRALFVAHQSLWCAQYLHNVSRFLQNSGVDQNKMRIFGSCLLSESYIGNGSGELCLARAGSSEKEGKTPISRPGSFKPARNAFKDGNTALIA